MLSFFRSPSGADRRELGSSYSLLAMQSSKKHWICFLARKSLFKLIDCFSTACHSVDSATYTGLLQSFTYSNSLNLGKSIHAHMIRNDFRQNVFLQNNLLNMYCKCGDISHAQHLFDGMIKKDVVSWNALVSGCFQFGFFEKALSVFICARKAQVSLDRFAYAGALSICSRTGDLECGKAVHGLVVVGGFSKHVFLTNSLMDMYSKCGRIEDVRRVFDNSDSLDDVSWNSLVSSYVRMGLGDETLKIFVQMHTVGCKINCFAVGSVLKCCSDSNEMLQFGRVVHGCVAKVGLDLDVFVGSAMIDMYAKNGELGEAAKFFKAMPIPNVVVFNATIAGFCRTESESHKEFAVEALSLYSEMQRGRMMPTKFTFSSVLKACNLTGSFELGKQVHAQVYKGSLHHDEFIGSALIDLYSDSGSIEDGYRCFSLMPKEDIVTWTSMISGCVQNEHFERALSLFDNLLAIGRKPDQFTLSSVMSACASLAISRSGEQIQSYATKAGFGKHMIFGNSQIFMYSRSGDTEAASQTFHEMNNHDVVSWSAMISSLAQHGCAKDALALFREMQNCRIAPNHITFLGVLTACSHGGLVDEGFRFFKSMEKAHAVVPNVKHCACIVDLLGRAGRLDDAEQFIMDSCFHEDPVMWRAVLSSCRIHCDIERAKRVSERIMELEPRASSTYVILYNMYLDFGKLSMAIKTRELMKGRGLKKEPGLSWIEIGGSIHNFVAGDISHPMSQAIYAKLEDLILSIERLGYVRSTTSELDDLEGNVNLLNCHSEKLAVTLGIISLPRVAPIRVMKNLRVCVDCHNTMKLFSAHEGREIILRDPIRFHRFRDGSCSCGDYW